ncbi:MAG TPA: EAL domain-containing protein [Paucimonas sp.]|nr:EAL domain-containing protein [Paucimonas sp.]
MMIRLSGTNASHHPIDASELAALLEHTQAGLVVVDAASGRTTFRNERADGLLGCTAGKADSYDCYVYGALHADGKHYQPHEFPIARALAGEFVRNAEVVYRGEGQVSRHLLMNAAPVHDEGGVIVEALASFVDISEQRRLERELADSRQKLSFILYGAQTMPWTLDIRSGAASIDASWFALLGYPPDRIKPTLDALLGIIHARDRPRVVHHWHDHLQGRMPYFEVSCRLRTATHEWRWVLIRAAVVERGEDGKPLRAAGALIDIDHVKLTELALHESEQRLRSTLEYAGVGIATVSAAGRWLSVNPRQAAITGYAADELLGAGAIDDILHPDDADAFHSCMRKLLKGDVSSFTRELRCVRKDGKTIWVDVTLSRVSDEHAGIKYLIAIFDDKTEKKFAQQQMEKAQAQLRMATRIAGLGFWEWDVKSGDVAFSEDWKSQLGYTDADLKDRLADWQTRIHPDDRERVLGYLRDFLEAPTPDYSQEFRTRDKDGNYRWISVRGLPVFDRRGELEKIVGTHLDITDQKNAQEDARLRAQHDPLTGLPNRGLFYEFSEHLVASARRAAAPLAVLFFDLDHFKSINDNYGHKVGDGVLKEVATRLSQLMRAEDVIGRVGGDEFVAILPKIASNEHAAVVAAKALESLRQPYRIDGIEVRMSPSIGISLYPTDGDNIDMLIQRADAAMYRVKHGERNNFRFFAQEWNGPGYRATPLEDRLRIGLERGEFDLHYQPVIDTRTGEVVGVEALLRWQQDDGRQIEPGAFIPVAETTGLIVPLGEWTFQQACRQHQAWIREGLPPIPVAINISAAQLRRGEFQHSIGHAISATGIDPARIEIEVTESTVMKNYDQAADVLHGLKLLGLKIALDDFGTGYSNLNQLSRLPLDKLKVDRSFVRYLTSDRSSLAIAEAIIALGRALGIDVVAEGIETEQDLNVLKEHDCFQAQGFHLGRPMPGEEFMQWYKKHWLH